MIPPERKQERNCPKVGNLVAFPDDAGRYPRRQVGGVGLVVDTIGLSLHILTDDGIILKGISRTSVEVLG